MIFQPSECTQQNRNLTIPGKTMFFHPQLERDCAYQLQTLIAGIQIQKKNILSLFPKLLYITQGFSFALVCRQIVDVISIRFMTHKKSNMYLNLIRASIKCGKFDFQCVYTHITSG